MFAQSTITLSPEKDNTLYEDPAGLISNGAGDFLFFGKTNNGDLRRALVKFDIATALSSGDSITAVTLTFQVSQVPNNTSRTSTLHTVDQEWGESSSNAPSNEGQGTNAANGDATWTQACFNCLVAAPWITPGGDFNSTPSATFDISDPQMVQDVQSWLTNPSTNFGWILLGTESVNQTAKRINSRENSSSPISLEVTFINTTTSLKELSNNDLKISPNPVNDEFTISGLSSFSDVELFDLNGSKKALEYLGNGKYNISFLDRGIYFLKVQSSEKAITKKIVKK
jgi:hypothetical protein